MSTLLLAMLALGQAQAGDLRAGITVLPAQLEGSAAMARAGDATRGIAAALTDSTSFRTVPLSASAATRLEKDPGCRDRAGCLASLLPTDATYVVDLRLADAGDQLALVLRLANRDETLGSVSTTVHRAGLGSAAKRELRSLLAGREPDADLYRQAMAGDAEATERLAREFPASPYLVALQEPLRRVAPNAQVAPTAPEVEPEVSTAPAPAPDPEPPPSNRSFVATDAAPSSSEPSSPPRVVTPEPSSSPWIVIPEPSPAPAPEAQSSTSSLLLLTEEQIPTRHRRGTTDQRYEALEAAESVATATGVIVWILMNDRNEDVRHKAWRVIRARWRRGTGVASHHQAATIWVFEHRTHERHEAAAVIAELGAPVFDGRDMLRMLGTSIATSDQRQRPALANATLILGQRVGKYSVAEAMVVDAIQREQSDRTARRMHSVLTNFE